MISHSPPIFSHSPPVSFLADFMSNNHRQGLNYNEEPNRASRYCRPQVITLASKAMVNNASSVMVTQQQQQQQQLRVNNIISFTSSSLATAQSAVSVGAAGVNPRNNLQRMVSAPTFPTLPKSCLSRKSCLHKNSTKQQQQKVHKDADTTNGQILGPETPEPQAECKCSEQCRSRKKVCFADDEGLSLTEVRVMSEPSNVPPYWSMKFLEQITQGLVSPHPADQWTVDFKQPASDYLSFRQKIEQDYVSLENVIVKDEESIVVGTVKVKNVDYEKEVIVRVTWDNWKSQQDIFCTYARAYGPATCAHVVFDTFSFKITLPPSSKCLEFCICYRAKNKEHWDNNNGKNYTITKRSPFYYNALSPYDKSPTRNNCQNHVMSTLTEALAQTKEQQKNIYNNNNNSSITNNNWPDQPPPSPYW